VTPTRQPLSSSSGPPRLVASKTGPAAGRVVGLLASLAAGLFTDPAAILAAGPAAGLAPAWPVFAGAAVGPVAFAAGVCPAAGSAAHTASNTALTRIRRKPPSASVLSTLIQPAATAKRRIARPKISIFWQAVIVKGAGITGCARILRSGACNKGAASQLVEKLALKPVARSKRLQPYE